MRCCGAQTELEALTNFFRVTRNFEVVTGLVQRELMGRVNAANVSAGQSRRAAALEAHCGFYKAARFRVRRRRSEIRRYSRPPGAVPFVPNVRRRNQTRQFPVNQLCKSRFCWATFRWQSVRVNSC